MDILRNHITHTVSKACFASLALTWLSLQAPTILKNGV